MYSQPVRDSFSHADVYGFRQPVEMETNALMTEKLNWQTPKSTVANRSIKAFAER